MLQQSTFLYIFISVYSFTLKSVVQAKQTFLIKYTHFSYLTISSFAKANALRICVKKVEGSDNNNVIVIMTIIIIIMTTEKIIMDLSANAFYSVTQHFARCLDLLDKEFKIVR